MSFRSLIPIFSRKFSHSRVNVILVKDYPILGFEGQILSVKPGYADKFLIPKQIAVYNFPCTHERLFPNWDETEVIRKREKIELKTFMTKLERVDVDIIKPASTTNPTFLKEVIRARDIAEHVRDLGIDIGSQNVKVSNDIDRFGSYVIQIEEFYSEKFDQKFNFKIKVNVKKEAPKEQLQIDLAGEQ